jgi:hypothetical protein
MHGVRQGGWRLLKLTERRRPQLAETRLKPTCTATRGGKGLKNSRSMTKYSQKLVAGLTLLKQFTVRAHYRGQNCGFNEGPYV